jgi:hypothetical protein
MGDNKYQKNMTKIDNLKKKFILIQIYTGFGNKVFDCIVGMYLKINFTYHVYYVDTRGPHTKSTDNSIAEIFPKITNEFEIIDDNQGDYIKYIMNYSFFDKNVDSIENLKKYFVEDKIRVGTTFLYKFVYKMFESFDDKIKKIFMINEKLINKDIISYSNTNYATIHIRYGDKLWLGLKKDNDNKNRFISFPIFTPEYYYEQIKILKKEKIPIVILTDSPNVIKHFLLKKYKIDNDCDIFLPDIPFLDSFYLMLKSNYLILSHSTFSYSAYILGKYNYRDKINKSYIFCTSKEFKTKYDPYDLIISDDWIIYENSKYILNFNQKLIKEMNNYNRKN